MRVLVTGGSGYIGGPTVRRLAEEGARVVVVDLLPPPRPLEPSIEAFVQGDIRSPELLDRALSVAPVDAVVHLAAHKSVEESVRDPGRYFDNNVAGTLCLLEAMRRARVESLVFSSTCAVYGTPSRVPVMEDAAVNPDSPYGASKAMAETAMNWYERTQALRFAALRYFNAGGASLEGDLGEDWTDAATLIPRVMQAVLGRSGPMTLYGTDYPTPDGTAIRDYVHVLDLADAHIAAVRTLLRGESPGIVNVGTGYGSSVREVLTLVNEAAGEDVPVVLGPRRAGDAIALWADNSRASAVLGWRPRYGLAEIIETAWRWHSTHLDG